MIYLDVQERIGYTFIPYCDSWSATLFSGFGYRYLEHKLKGAHWDLRNTLENVVIELPLTYARSCYSFIVKPFYEHWEDGKSTAKASNEQSLDLPKKLL